MKLGALDSLWFGQLELIIIFALRYFLTEPGESNGALLVHSLTYPNRALGISLPGPK